MPEGQKSPRLPKTDVEQLYFGCSSLLCPPQNTETSLHVETRAYVMLTKEVLVQRP